MGIKGIYQEIGPGDRISLSKLAVQKFEETGRPLRLAIDISIWLFQIQAGKGGKSPALRTFYYRLLRLIACSIHPLFVFDGPNRPQFKRNKRTGPNIASIPEYLARDLLKRFGLPFHQAPGEAEAECALLQQQGVVDAVLSEDVDTLMFGSGLTFRNWTGEGTSAKKVPTHVNVYDAYKTKNGTSGLDRPGMILVALMSGGDYIPEGIPGCGSKTACEAARADFGVDLCKLDRKDKSAIAQWKEKLSYELKTNESKMFKQKHKALIIPDDFPRMDVLRYYTHPCVSSLDQIEMLKNSITWDQPFDIPALRQFTAEAFEWLYLGGAKKFIRNLAPALLVRELRLCGVRGGFISDDTHAVAEKEARLVRHIFKQRSHGDTDGMLELQVGFFPVDIVPIDLSAEEPDPIDTNTSGDDLDEDTVASKLVASATGDPPCSPKPSRRPPNYDPTALEKLWILETFVKVGVPLKVEDWKETFRNAEQYERQKAASKKAAQEKRKLKATGGMPKGALDKFTKVTKPGLKTVAPKIPLQTDEPLCSDHGLHSTQNAENADVIFTSSVPATEKNSSSQMPNPGMSILPEFRLPTRMSPFSPIKSTTAVIEIVSSPDSQPRPKRRTLRRSQSESIQPTDGEFHRSDCSINVLDVAVDLSTSSSGTQLPIPSSVTTRRPRSPLRKVHTIYTDAPSNSHLIVHSPASPVQVLHPIPNQLNTIPADPIATLPTRKSTNSPITTPKKPHPRQDVIVITSSPASPRTPRSAQTMITDFMPRSGRGKTPTPNASNIRSARHGSRLAVIDEPPSPSPKPRHKVSGARPAPTFKIPAALQGDVAMNETAKSSKSHGGVFRLRENLDGAWKLDSTGNAAGHALGEASDVQGAKSSRKRGRGRNQEWRVSQVEVLDMTYG